jgi:hypothetical protein
VTVRQRDQHHEAALAFHEGRHRVHALAHEQVAFPVAGHGTVVRFGGSFTNVERGSQLTLAVHHRVASRPASRVLGTQKASQFLA